MSQQGTWKKARRTIYSRLIERDRQLCLLGVSLDSVIITNLGMGEMLLRINSADLVKNTGSRLTVSLARTIDGVMMKWPTGH